MGFYLPCALAFLAVLVAANHAVLSPERYWKSTLPNTPMPKAVSNLLQPDQKTTTVYVGKGGGVTIVVGDKPTGTGSNGIGASHGTSESSGNITGSNGNGSGNSGSGNSGGNNENDGIGNSGATNKGNIGNGNGTSVGENGSSGNGTSTGRSGNGSGDTGSSGSGNSDGNDGSGGIGNSDTGNNGNGNGTSVGENGSSGNGNSTRSSGKRSGDSGSGNSDGSDGIGNSGATNIGNSRNGNGTSVGRNESNGSGNGNSTRGSGNGSGDSGSSGRGNSHGNDGSDGIGNSGATNTGNNGNGDETSGGENGSSGNGSGDGENNGSGNSKGDNGSDGVGNSGATNTGNNANGNGNSGGGNASTGNGNGKRNNTNKGNGDNYKPKPPPRTRSITFNFNHYGVAKNQLLNDPNVTLFFLEKDIHKGARMNLHFVKTSNEAAFLPRHITEPIPFSSAKLPEILVRFSVMPRSEEAEMIKETINDCESPTIEGEEKSCPTSLEAMVDFITSKLGRNVEALSTEVAKDTGKQTYTVTQVAKKTDGENSVVCHKQSYMYVVFYCHASHTMKTFSVSLEAVDGSKAKAVAVCHTDTSAWNPKHVAFQILKVNPGTPVCHFLPEEHIVWIPVKKSA